MNQLSEFIQRHPLLVSLAALLAIAAVVIEFRHRGRGGTAVSPNEAVQLMNSGAALIDVRNAEQFSAGHIIDARNIAQADLAGQTDSLKKYRDKPVIVYCETGTSAGAAASALKAAGFTKVLNLRGGLAAWKQDNLPLVTGTRSKKTGKAA
ncbi:MAG: rhodanese-like domain-containing protein [Candidatus Obscuribacterales bacterium]|nr:rhodanese-like domain-containing protein [Steroidobacteraceae bacterium]